MKRHRWLVLSCGCLLLAAVAVLYSWSIFAAPLESAYGWSRVETSAVFTISICFYCAGSLLAGRLAAAVRPALLLAFSGLLIGAGFAVSAAFSSLPGFWLGYGVCCGTGVGMAYNVVVGQVGRLFPDKSGLASGLLLMSYGFGSLAVSELAGLLIATAGWKAGFFVFAGAECLLLLLGALLLTLGGRRARQEDAAPAASAAALPEDGLSPRDMLRTKTFYLLFFWLMLLTAAGLTMIGSAALMLGSLGLSPQRAALMTGLISFIGGFGRLGFGCLLDRCGERAALQTDTFAMAGSTAFLLAAFLLRNIVLASIGFFALGLAYGGMSSLCASLVLRYFGVRQYPRNLSIVALQMLPATLAGPMLASAAYTAAGSYAASCAVALLLGVLSIALMFFLVRRPVKPSVPARAQLLQSQQRKGNFSK